MVKEVARRLRPTGPVIGVSAVIVVLLLIAPLPWVSWGKEIDINSGRVRSTTWVVGFPLSQRMEETWVSHATEPLGEPDWHYAVTHDWWNHVSPHYSYHGAVSQVEAITMFAEELEWDDDARRLVGQRLLQRWHAGSYWEAEAYIQQLETILQDKQLGPKENQHVTTSDLLGIPITSNGVEL